MQSYFPFFNDNNLIAVSFSKTWGGFDKKGLSLDFKNKLFNFTGDRQSKFVYSRQAHGTKIRSLSKNNLALSRNFFGVDGFICASKKTFLLVQHADCLPIFFYDPQKKVVAIAHSGWKGTKAKIGLKVLKKMKKNFDCRTKDILIAIGPGARRCCYFHQDNSPLVGLSEWKGFINKKNKAYQVDMPGFIKRMFLTKRIYKTNITDCGICSICCDDFLSKRRQGNSFQSGLSMIGMK